MKRADFLRLLLLPAATGSRPGLAAQATSATFSNPLPVAIGDPFVLYDETLKRYFLYGTGGVRDGFGVHSSTDLVDWKFEGPIYRGNTPGSWCISHFWAPEVYRVAGKFYLFYSAQWRDNPTNELENFRIGVAIAAAPTGPFTDLQSAPLFDPGYPIIDANVFFDRDGRVYLYFSRCCYKHPVESEIAQWARARGWYQEIEESWVYGIELKPDLSGVIGQPALLLRPPATMDDRQAEWESRSVTSREINRRWTEGSFTFRHGDTYYMMYSANHFAGENYAVGYATGAAPLGPYTKAASNPVLEKNTGTGGEVTGTGHNSIAFSPEGKPMYCVYHGRTAKTGEKRVVFLDRLEIRDDGELRVHGPTTTPQPVPGFR